MNKSDIEYITEYNGIEIPDDHIEIFQELILKINELESSIKNK